MEGGRKLITVTIEKGYLTLTSQEALDLFNDQVDSGLLWQFLSQLFNDYVDGKQNNSMDNRINQMLELQKKMLEYMSRTNVKTLPSDKFVEPKEPAVVKEVSVQSKSLKPKKGGSLFGSLVNKFDTFKD